MAESNYTPDPRPSTLSFPPSRGYGGQIYMGTVPPAAPANRFQAAIWYPASGGSVKVWVVASQSWV